MPGNLQAEARKSVFTLEQEQRVQNIIWEIIGDTHTSLEKVRITLFPIDSDAYFLISNFGASRALLGRPHYRIGLNPYVFKKNISDLALKGVMAHELMHTEDYESGSTIGTIIPIGFKILKRKSRIQYERKTDIKTIQRGYAEGLKAYRLWQSELLSPESLEIKEEEYLTPFEIDLVSEIVETQPELIESWLKNTAPINAEAILIDKVRFGNNFDESNFHADIEQIRASMQIRNRGQSRSGGKSYQIELVSRQNDLRNCQVTAIPQFRKGRYFYKYRQHFDNIDLKRGKKVKLRFKSNYNFYMGVIRVYDCENDLSFDSTFLAD
jgi:hypothetical protein